MIAANALRSLIFDKVCNAWPRARAPSDLSSATSLGTVISDGNRVKAHVSMSRT